MEDAQPTEPIQDVLSAANWIADVVDADRDDSSRSTVPPAPLAASSGSLLNRVVEAERDSLR